MTYQLVQLALPAYKYRWGDIGMHESSKTDSLHIHFHITGVVTQRASQQNVHTPSVGHPSERCMQILVGKVWCQQSLQGSFSANSRSLDF